MGSFFPQLFLAFTFFKTNHIEYAFVFHQSQPMSAQCVVARDSPSRRQQPTIGHATNDLSSGSAGEDDIGLQGCFPTKPQLARSATSRDQKAFKNQGGSDNKEAPPEAEDLPIDEVRFSCFFCTDKGK